MRSAWWLALPVVLAGCGALDRPEPIVHDERVPVITYATAVIPPTAPLEVDAGDLLVRWRVPQLGVKQYDDWLFAREVKNPVAKPARDGGMYQESWDTIGENWLVEPTTVDLELLLTNHGDRVLSLGSVTWDFPTTLPHPPVVTVRLPPNPNEPPPAPGTPERLPVFAGAATQLKPGDTLNLVIRFGVVTTVPTDVPLTIRALDVPVRMHDDGTAAAKQNFEITLELTKQTEDRISHRQVRIGTMRAR